MFLSLGKEIVMDLDAYFRLSEQLGALQTVLSTELPANGFDERIARIERAAEIRLKLWEAIAAYRDSYCEIYR
jgi:hypothetical protein